MTDFRKRKDDGRVFPMGEGKEHRINDNYGYKKDQGHERRLTMEEYIKTYHLKGLEETVALHTEQQAFVLRKDQFFWHHESSGGVYGNHDKWRLQGVSSDGTVYPLMASVTRNGGEVEVYIPTNIKKINNTPREEFIQDLKLFPAHEEIWEAKFVDEPEKGEFGRKEKLAHDYANDLRRKIQFKFNTTR